VREKRVGWITVPRCVVCGSTEDVEYCSICREYMCRRCERDPSKWPLRIKLAFEKLLFREGG